MTLGQVCRYKHHVDLPDAVIWPGTLSNEESPCRTPVFASSSPRSWAAAPPLQPRPPTRRPALRRSRRSWSRHSGAKATCRTCRWPSAPSPARRSPPLVSRASRTWRMRCRTCSSIRERASARRSSRCGESPRIPTTRAWIPRSASSSTASTWAGRPRSIPGCRPRAHRVPARSPGHPVRQEHDRGRDQLHHPHAGRRACR